MIYREHPEVGAILHVHAWIEGTVATEINYPCGTVELAESVAELVRQAPDPSAPSSASATTASPSPATASTRSSTASTASIVRKVPMD